MVLYSLRDFIQPVFSHSCVLCKLPVEIPICESVAPNMHRACSRQIIIPGMDALVLQLMKKGFDKEGIQSIEKLGKEKAETTRGLWHFLHYFHDFPRTIVQQYCNDVGGESKKQEWGIIFPTAALLGTPAFSVWLPSSLIHVTFSLYKQNDFDGNPRIVLNLFFLSLVSLPASVGRCSSFAGSALGIAEEPQMKISIAQFSFLFLLFAFFTSISAISPSLDWRSNFILGEENLGSWKGEISRGAQAPGPANNGPQSTLVLAAKRTNRPDILRGFKRYRGGWDITNRHYWASVGFTGAFGFILAFLWLVSFGLALVVHYCCGWRINAKGNGSDHSERVSLIMLILFTCAAAIGCILLSIGQDEFHREALHTLHYVVNQSDYTVQTLINVTQYLTLAKTIKVAQVLLPSNVNDDIDKLNVDLNKAANDLKEKTSENSAKIKKVFNTVRSALITVAAVMLLLSLLGFFLSILGHQHAIHVFIVGGWLLVVITFMLCGVFVILNNAITDTCMAMGEWMDNPQSESALSNILPCVDQRTSNQTLIKSKEVVTNIVNVVNQFIYTYANANPSPTDLNYYNQSGPLMPPLCYPYDSNLQDRQCGSIEVSMENASVVWKNYVCTKSELGLCNNEGRVTQDTYTQLVAAVNESYALEHYTPPLLSLQNCNFVQDTFREIKTRYCHPLEHDLQMVDAGLGLISVGVMLCLVLWIFYANHPQREGVFVTLFSPIRKRQK